MALTEKEIELTRVKYLSIKDCLSEKGRRLWSAIEARSYGREGVTSVNKATGISTATIYKGFRELDNGSSTEGIRSKGGGRKSLKIKYPDLVSKLESLIDP